MCVMQLYLLVFLSSLSCVFADIYLHNPRGSNNRLNEKTATRTNANRLFDSQNNNRGGYNVGDALSTPFQTEAQQYNMKYFSTSELPIEWTNQHGCGGNSKGDPHKQKCEVILQYMCSPATTTSLRNGINTGSQNTNAEDSNRGLHEPLTYYKRCQVRNRNKGLFAADQKLKQETAQSTRQNPNGNRSGFECPEERDYYPYWHSSPWIDIAVLTDDVSRCDMYRRESFNGRPRGECVLNGNRLNKFNTADSCKANKGQWVEFRQYLEKMSINGCRYTLGVPWDSATNKVECLVPPPKLECKSAPWSRSNHLGDVRGEGHAMRYNWKLPEFPSGLNKRCVLRVRYNITTGDYDPWRTNASFNGAKSPIRNLPLVQIDNSLHPLRLAINTNQVGRTFQDRSHVFEVLPLPKQVPRKSRLVNLNVRGKRGNIVQVYPAVEYDFIPNRLSLKENDLVHLQWTGSNTHNNGGGGGDGQAGDDGEGKTGTDRNNFLEHGDPADNFPTPYEASKMFNTKAMKIVWSSFAATNVDDAAIQAASSGYFMCKAQAKCGPQSVDVKAAISTVLDNASPSFGGFIFSLQKGKYYYMCTRNNNFSNRSQKGHIIVS